MEQKRAQTLEALATFIETQNTLLVRTQSDIERLRELRTHSLSDTSQFLSNLDHELNASSFRLTDQTDCEISLPVELDWSVYAKHDPTPLHNLSLSANEVYMQRNQPHTYQRSELSDLQRFVKDAKQSILDPVFATLDPISESEDEGAKPVAEIRHAGKRGKIPDYKRRKMVACGLTISSFRPRGAGGLFIRKDVEDESMDVDILPADDQDRSSRSENISMDVDTPVTLSTPPPPRPAPKTVPKSSRVRRPSTKVRALKDPENPVSARVPPARRQSLHSNPPTPEAPPPVSKPLQKTQARVRKSNSETYKQTWSVSEQHLLEKLLEEIPEGEKNRWKKISNAMDGKRTPRQVASRVQKYFEKLKRFGIGVDDGGGLSD